MVKKAWRVFEITKVKLNPEQAVLSCCQGDGRDFASGDPRMRPAFCGQHDPGAVSS